MIKLFSILTLLNCDWDGIDISEIQGPNVDFDKVKAAGKKFCNFKSWYWYHNR